MREVNRRTSHVLQRRRHCRVLPRMLAPFYDTPTMHHYAGTFQIIMSGSVCEYSYQSIWVASSIPL